MVQDDSHSTLRASADNISRRWGSVGIGVPPGTWKSAGGILVLLGAAKFSNFRAVPAFFGMIFSYRASFSDFIPMPDIDAIDRKILGALQTNSRITMAELADK